jgi:YebC/PmpR family DNA-binding regulatory protein
MPAENIDRAIKKGTGELEGVDYQEIAYEGYGHGGAALYIETLTDNANRTVAEIRFTMNKYGGSLGTSGSVAWQFERQGQIYVDAGRHDEETTMLAALEAGALDLERQDDQFVIATGMTEFAQVQEALRSQGITFSGAELAMVPRNMVDVKGEDAQKLVRLMEMLDDLDDVQKVWTNAELDEAALTGAEA